ncbi:hypothetical protein [Streptomyces sp. WAC06614]|uniref:hypothetical protein n=1 Tax=Streptomyces sp. WAC06614 TaxID=2487416 RepID=UPI000F7ADF93|nr:hypothetical protein [Streptomyces sp. WAC06614]RSS79236.1 hypothetical protein EF918_18090 [Streptomyces sp. WAC06614]
MRILPYRLAALGLAALFGVAAAPVPSAVADGTPFHKRHTAAQISRFLTDFYGHHGPSRHNRTHRVSQQLKDKQRNTPDQDVVLCAAHVPQDITVGEVTVAQSAGVGWATVTTHWGAGEIDTMTAYVRLDSRPIALDDVICGGPATPRSPSGAPS